MSNAAQLGPSFFQRDQVPPVPPSWNQPAAGVDDGSGASVPTDDLTESFPGPRRLRVMSRRPLRTGVRSPLACAVTLSGAVLLASSALLQWASLGVGHHSASATLISVPLASMALVVAVLAIGGGAVATLAGREGGLDFAALAGATVAIVVTAFIVGSDIAATATPDDPASVLAAGLGPSAGMGAWLALAAATVVVIAAARPIRERMLATTRDARGRRAFSISAVAALVLGLVVLVQLRFEAWLEGTAFGATLPVDAGALPLVSSVTLLAVLLLAGGILLVCIGYQQLGALVAAASGWLANAAAATTIVGAQTLAGLHLHVVRVSLAVWLVFAVGLAVAGAAGILVSQTGGQR